MTSVTYGRRVNSIDEWIVKENIAAMDCKFIRFRAGLHVANDHVSARPYEV